MKPEVVQLTKDLNGNHVIQKCLNRLDSDDKQVYLRLRDHVDESLFMMPSQGNVLMLLHINMVAAYFKDVLITQMCNKENNSMPNSSRTPSNCLKINLETTSFNIFWTMTSLICPL